jgi:hypothetical protein
MAARMYNINCSSARHFEAFADIPQELADKIVAYRKIRKRIFHIDELYRIAGISRKYFRQLTSVFYVPNQVVPRIGAQPPYSNAISTVTVQQKHQNRNANLKKRKMKIKMCENQRKIENRDRKRELKRGGISTQSMYKPLPALGKKCNLNSTNLKKLNTHSKLAENLGKKVQKKEGKYRRVKRRKTTDTEQSSVQSSESAPSTRRANINETPERVVRLLAAIPKLEGDNKDMEEDNIHVDMEEDNIHIDMEEDNIHVDMEEDNIHVDMEEDNIHVDMEEDNIDMEEALTYRKRPYRCVKRPETTDTENSCDSSESIPSLESAIVQLANINERVVRSLATAPKLEFDNIDMEEVLTYRKRPYRCVKRPETTDAENSSDSSEPTPSLASTIVQRANINERVNRLLTAIPKLEGDNTDMEEDNIHVNMEEDNIIDVEEVLTYRKRPYRCVKRQETTDTEHSCDSSLASAIVRRANINERVAGLLAAIPKLEGDNIDLEENNVEMEEDNSLTNRKRKYQSVKSHETTDIDQRSKHSVSITASVIEQECNDAMKRVARWILAIPNFESDTMDMEEDNIEMDKENIRPGHVYI